MRLPSGASGVKKKKTPHLPIARDVRDAGSIPGSGRSPGGGHGNLLQYSCLENPMDRGEPGGLQSIVLQRVRQNWGNLTGT